MSQPSLEFPHDIRAILKATWRYRNPLIQMSIVATFVFVAVSLVFPLDLTKLGQETPLDGLIEMLLIMLGLYFLLVPLLVSVMSLGFLDVMRSGRFRPRLYMRRLWERLLPLTAVLVIDVILIGVGMLVWIIPGYVLSFLLMYAPLLVLIEGRSVKESLLQSVTTAWRNLWKLLLISYAVVMPVVVIQFVLSGVVVGGVGLIVFAVTVLSFSLYILASASLHTLTYMRLFPRR